MSDQRGREISSDEKPDGEDANESSDGSSAQDNTDSSRHGVECSTEHISGITVPGSNFHALKKIVQGLSREEIQKQEISDMMNWKA